MKLILKLTSVLLVSVITLMVSFGLLSVMTASANAIDNDKVEMGVIPSAPLKAWGDADDYGYTYQDEQETDGPIYVFTDISSTGTLLVFDTDDGDSDITSTMLSGFEFEFYGDSLTTLRVGNDGAMIVNPDKDKISPQNNCLGSIIEKNRQNMIAPWWDDWDDITGRVYWDLQGSGDNEYLIVQWDSMVAYEEGSGFGLNPDNQSVTFQAVLYEKGNVIEFHYEDTVANTTPPSGLGVGGTIGIQSKSPISFLEYGCNTDVLTNSRAIRFQRSVLEIKKVTVSNPGDTTGFDFEVTGGAVSTTTTDVQNDETWTNYLLPGSYTATETVPADWVLTEIRCEGDLTGDVVTVSNPDPTQITSVGVAPGETTTCTFTNTELSNILIDKATDLLVPDTTVFTFTTSTLTPTFNLQDGGQQRLVVMPNSVYTVTESTIPADWDLAAISCDDGSPTDLDTATATITPSAGITVTCTYTNAKLSTIIIEKITDPASDPTSFDFTTTGGLSPTTFALSLTDGLTRSFEVVSGIYTVTEDVPSNWDLALTCDDPSGTILTPSARIDLGVGETVTCSYTNTKRGTIYVDKVTDPNPDGTATEFTFTTNIVLTPTFTLANADTPAALTVPPGNYLITETVPTNWNLNEITCNGTIESTPTAEIGLSAGQIVTCVFTNQAALGSITVTKVTSPSGGSGFSFQPSSNLGGGASFSLDDGQSKVYTDITPGLVYSATEIGMPLDWDEESSCSNGSTTDDIYVGAGEGVTCVFTNTKRGVITVTKVTLPSGDTTDFDFHLEGGPDSEDQTFSLADGESQDSGAIKPGAYTITETNIAALTDWDLTGTSCDNGDSIDDVNLPADGTVTCTFTNTKRSTVRIIKDAVPNYLQNFTFTTDIPSYAEFTLEDDGVGTGNVQEMSVSPGSYVITETTLPPNWNFTSVGCVEDKTTDSGGNFANQRANIEAQPGETITCTFTNTADNGQIIVQKITTPTIDTQEFTFTSNFTSDFGLSTGGGAVPISRTFVISPSATAYSVEEDESALPISWDLTASACTEGTNSDIYISPGETVTCTFTNTKRGVIYVDKVTNPSGHSGSFDFNLQGNEVDDDFSLTDASTPYSNTLKPATYSITETVTGWSLATSCTSGTIDNVNLAAGGVVTCTFTNTADPGTITINKVADPKDAQVFAYLGSPSPLTSFELVDDGSGISDTITFTNVASGSYIIIEGATAGWSLADIDCNDPTGDTTTDEDLGRANIELSPGEDIDCTFYNDSDTKYGAITIVKSATPTGTQKFTFTSNIPSNANFTLVDNSEALSNTRTMLNLLPGTYAVTETVPSDWNLDSIFCIDPDGGTSTGGATAIIDLDGGESVTCTYYNEEIVPSTGTITIIKDASPTGSQEFPFIGDLGNFTLVDNGNPLSYTLVQAGLTAGTYVVTETAVTGWNLTDLVCSDPTAVINGSTATIDLAGGESVTCTFTNTQIVVPPGGNIYLPIIMKEPKPDLVGVLSISPASPSSTDDVVVTVIVTNQGTASTGDGFWVDFYIDPSTPPTQANQRWETVSTEGVAWVVTAPLGAGDSIILRSDGSGDYAPSPDHTRWDGTLDNGSRNLYSYVDSFSLNNSADGGIVESDETNNRDDLNINITGLSSTSDYITELPELPPRWDP